MNKICSLFMSALLAATVCVPAFAADAPAGQKPAGPSKLLGAPVNVGIAGGSILPEGMLLTALNASFRDKQTQIRGTGSPDVFSQIWLLKIRYGLTDRVEVSAVTPYISNQRDVVGSDYIEGLGDVTLGASVALLSQRAGDPMWLTLSGGLLMPTGQYGKRHIPGVGVLGGRAALSATKFFSPNWKADMDLVWSGPFGEGNQHVTRGNEYNVTGQVRYMFDDLPIDIGLESIWTKVESGEKDGLPPFVAGADGKMNIHNGTSEWVMGPSMNVAIEPLKMWVGAGAFFPLHQSADGPAKMEDVRWEFKIGKIW